MFFLSLFQSATNATPPDVGPANAATVEQISELSKVVEDLKRALQIAVLGPTNAGVTEQINELAKVLNSTLLAPANSGVIEQINELAKQLKALQIVPANAATVEQIGELSKIVAALSKLIQAPLIEPTNAGVTEQISELAKQLKAFQINPTNDALLGQIAALQNEIKSFYLLPPNQLNNNGVNSADIVTTIGAQTISGAKTFTSPTNQFLGLTYATSDGGSGSNAYFGENLAYAAIGGVNGLVVASGATFPGTGRYVGDAAAWRPFVDATYTCGTSVQRWSSMYTINLAVSGTVTSGVWNGSTIGVAYGGTGTATPSLVAGTNVTITGTWPNQTINSYSSGGSGTVTSVAATVPSFLSVSGSPITTSGTLAISYSGTALPIANGGTGASSFAAAGLPTLSGSNTFSGVITTTNQNNQLTAITYSTTDGIGGSNAYLGENTAYAVVGGVNGVLLASGATFPGTGRYIGDSASWRPFADATYSLGDSARRWTAVYAVNGTIQTSDRNEKQQIAELDAAELAVAKRIKGLIRKFKFNDAVIEKGGDARIHVGVVAQDVEAAFVAEGLDASKYGLFCSDTWTTLDGKTETRLGVRYGELLAFVIGSL